MKRRGEEVQSRAGAPCDWGGWWREGREGDQARRRRTAGRGTEERSGDTMQAMDGTEGRGGLEGGRARASKRLSIRTVRAGQGSQLVVFNQIQYIVVHVALLAVAERARDSEQTGGQSA